MVQLPRQQKACRTPPRCCWPSGRASPQVRGCLWHRPDFQWLHVRGQASWLSKLCHPLSCWREGWDLPISGSFSPNPACFLSKRFRSSSPWRAAPPGASIPSCRKPPGRSCGPWRVMTERSVPSSRWELMGECWSGGMCEGTPSLA